MRPSVVACTVALFASLGGSTALADDAACVAAASTAQKLRREHLLLEAREQLVVCGAGSCPSVVQADCVTWLAEVDKATPTVLLTAKNSAGVDVFDVKVMVDGKPFRPRLDGHPAALNDGVHTFRFEAADGSSVEQQVLVREGAKDQPVALVLHAVGQPGASAPPPPTQPGPWKTVGWAGIGVGAAGVIVGAVFGALTLSTKGAHCSNGVCDPGTVSKLDTDADVSDIGLIAGGVIAAGGVALLLFGPSGGHEAAASIRVTPVFTSNGGEIVAAGSF